MAWHRIGDKIVSEAMMIQFTDVLVLNEFKIITSRKKRGRAPRLLHVSPSVTLTEFRVLIYEAFWAVKQTIGLWQLCQTEWLFFWPGIELKRHDFSKSRPRHLNLLLYLCVPKTLPIFFFVVSDYTLFFIRPFEKRDVLCRGNVRPSVRLSSVRPSVRPSAFSGLFFNMLWDINLKLGICIQ